MSCKKERERERLARRQEAGRLIYRLEQGFCQVYKFIDHRNRHRCNRLYLSISPGSRIDQTCLFRRSFLRDTAPSTNTYPDPRDRRSPSKLSVASSDLLNCHVRTFRSFLHAHESIARRTKHRAEHDCSRSESTLKKARTYVRGPSTSGSVPRVCQIRERSRTTRGRQELFLSICAYATSLALGRGCASKRGDPGRARRNSRNSTM